MDKSIAVLRTAIQTAQFITPGRGQHYYLLRIESPLWIDLCEELGVSSNPHNISCPSCNTRHIRAFGNYIKGGHRYECMNQDCERWTFIDKQH